MARHRTVLLALITIGLGFVAFLGTAELVLRFLPVSSGLRALPVTADDPVFRFTSNRSYVFSKEWNFQMVNYGRVNNAGWVNDQDYQTQSAVPLLAVIGDSFIEALMVPYRDTLEGRLAADYADHLRVYSFAGSGAPLSQYLIWAQHAVKVYGAKALVINVVGNDFDESLAAYKAAPGFWHYVPDADGVLRLHMFRNDVSLATWIVRRSAFLRYLAINLHAGSASLANVYEIFAPSARQEPRYSGNTSTSTELKRVKDSLAAIDAFLRDLPVMTGLPSDRVAFTLDGVRYPRDSPAGPESYFELMRRVFREKAEALGYEVLDLDPLFFARFSATGERFEFPADNHWNSNGHAIVALAVRSSRLLAHVLAASSSGH